jgi:two-component system chemotaxis response regulator CheB
MSSELLFEMGKPHGLPSCARDAQQLIDQVKAMAEVKVVTRRPPRARAGKPAVSTASEEPPAVIAIGTSTGGPAALHALLNGLPATLSVPIVVVQHLSTGFIGGFARWLGKSTPLNVKVAANGDVLRPGTVYLAPDDNHLKVSSPGVCWLRDWPPVDGHRPSATVLLRSVAESFGRAAIGVLLTGMGHDGAQGLKQLHEAGGYTIVQDEATSIVFGMSKAAADLQAAREVLALDHIGARLCHLVKVAMT